MAHKALLSAGAAAIGTVAPFINEVVELRVPSIFMDIFQCVAWLSAGVIAIITFLKYIKNSK